MSLPGAPPSALCELKQDPLFPTLRQEWNLSPEGEERVMRTMGDVSCVTWDVAYARRRRHL